MTETIMSVTNESVDNKKIAIDSEPTRAANAEHVSVDQGEKPPTQTGTKDHDNDQWRECLTKPGKLR